MSSTISVYAVPTERLSRVIGSRDRAIIEAIVAQQQSFLSSIDEIDDEAEMSCADAVAELIDGARSAEGRGYLYGYALEAICAHVGEELPNICPIARASRWIDEVDAALEASRIPIRLCDLVFGICPVPIPMPDDSPCIGQWSASAIRPALAAMRSFDRTGLDGDMGETFEQICGWLEAAARPPGSSIVGFLS